MGSGLNHPVHLPINPDRKVIKGSCNKMHLKICMILKFVLLFFKEANSFLFKASSSLKR